MPFRRGSARRSYGARSRSSSRRRPVGGRPFMKRARTRAYANIRTGGLLAIERKFSDWARSFQGLTPGGAGVANAAASTWSPTLISPDVYRTATGSIFNTSVDPKALNVLGTGDSGSDRDGRQVINDSIHLRGVVQFLDGVAPAATDVSQVVNIVLVLDTQNNGSQPAGSSVFVNPGDFSGVSADPGSCPFVNLANSKRFRILKHIRRMLIPTSLAASYQPQGGFIWAMDVPLKGMKTNYVTDTGNSTGQATCTAIGDNAIYLFAWCQTAASCAISFSSRLRFRG